MYELGRWIWEHRDQPLTWATAMSFMWLILDKLGRKLINNQLKRLLQFNRKSDFSKYVENQKRIESKVDMLLEERGLVWDADWKIGKPDARLTVGAKTSLTSSLAGYVPVVITKSFTRVTEIFHSRGKRTMTNKLLSRKFLLTILTAVIVACNDALGWNLSQDTIITISGVVVSYIAVEGARDIASKKSEVTSEYTTKEDAGSV